MPCSALASLPPSLGIQIVSLLSCPAGRPPLHAYTHTHTSTTTTATTTIPTPTPTTPTPAGRPGGLFQRAGGAGQGASGHGAQPCRGGQRSTASRQRLGLQVCGVCVRSFIWVGGGPGGTGRWAPAEYSTGWQRAGASRGSKSRGEQKAQRFAAAPEGLRHPWPFSLGIPGICGSFAAWVDSLPATLCVCACQPRHVRHVSYMHRPAGPPMLL